MIELYEKYHLKKEHTMIGLFREIKRQFPHDRVFYPGSYVHIPPSLLFPEVVYIDSFKDLTPFFNGKDVEEYIMNNKEYQEEPRITFYHQDYYKDIPEDPGSFDIIISQYGGFVGQATKKYLKKGGILVCNNSHGDASMSSIDIDYNLIGVYKRISDDKFSLSDRDLSSYMIPKKEQVVTREGLERTMKGIAYTKSPAGYIFIKEK